MDFFDNEVVSYAVLSDKVKAYAQKPDGSLRAAELRPDDRCSLGQWIAKERGKFGETPEYTKLCDLHTRFHGAAADVVTLADVDAAQGQAALEKPEFRVTFAHFIKAIVLMKAKAR